MGSPQKYLIRKVIGIFYILSDLKEMNQMIVLIYCVVIQSSLYCIFSSSSVPLGGTRTQNQASGKGYLF